MPDDEPITPSGVRRGALPARTQRSFAVAQRRAQALELRVAGASLAQIAEALNYSRAPDGSVRTGPVAQDVKRALQSIVAPAVEEMRELELARLDAIQRARWPGAIGTGPTAQDDCRVVIKCIEARCKLLGIYAPQKVDMTAWLRDFAEREGLPYDFAVSAANDIVAKAGF